MIYSDLPSDWRDLQFKTAKILEESGFEVQVEKTMQLARGEAEVDVYAVDPTTTPSSIYLVECKHWNRSVPKSVVHSFRTVVSDAGSHHGLIISKEGFQAGAYEAIKHTNVRLLDWGQFETLFEERWFKSYAGPRIYEECHPLVSYTEPINSTVFRATKELDEKEIDRLSELRTIYGQLAFLALTCHIPLGNGWTRKPDSASLSAMLLAILPKESPHLSNMAIDAPVALRDFVDIVTSECAEGIALFDDLFNRRVVS